MRLNANLFFGFAIIALAFPVAETVGIYYVWQAIGAWTLLWLVLAGLWGVVLLLDVQQGWLFELASGVQQGESPLDVLKSVGFRVLAGLAFIFPGLLSDVIGTGLLLLSWFLPAPARYSGSDARGAGRTGRTSDPFSSGDVIEGEYRREDGDGRPPLH